MDKLRLLFEKTGRAVYISHLDLMRTMQRAFLRAELPLRYSEGFNPHAQISMLLPLPLGQESVCELMDFRVYADCDLAAQLSAVLPEGIAVRSAYEPLRKGRDLKWLRVSGRFIYDNGATQALAEKLEQFFSRESIVILRRTKRGEGESDIRPAIREFSVQVQGSEVLLDAVVSAQEPTLNPELPVSALRQLAAASVRGAAYLPRTAVSDAEMQEFR